MSFSKNKIGQAFKKELIRYATLFIIMLLINKLFGTIYNIQQDLCNNIPILIFGFIMFIKDIIQIKFLYIKAQIVNSKTGDPISYIYEGRKLSPSDRTLGIELKISLNKCILKNIIYKYLDFSEATISIKKDNEFTGISLQPMGVKEYVDVYPDNIVYNLKPLLDNFCNSSARYKEPMTLKFKFLVNLDRDCNISKVTSELYTELNLRRNNKKSLNKISKQLLFQLDEDKKHEIRIRK